MKTIENWRLTRGVDCKTGIRSAFKAGVLWFHAMAHLKGTPVRHCNQTSPKAKSIIGSQKVSLLKTNASQDGNPLHWQALCDYYQLDLP